MHIGILGSGPAGRTLARGFRDKGHHVMIGSRSPERLADWQAGQGAGIAVGTFAETAAFAELAVLSALGSGVAGLLALAGPERLAGKVLIDASDPLDFSSGRPGLFVGTTDSLGEQVQRALPGTRVVKALNTVLADVMVNPALTGGEPDMFVAGDDAGAKAVVTLLLQDFGWPVIDMGGIESARWLEALSLAWVVHSHRTGKVLHAFKLVGK